MLTTVIPPTDGTAEIAGFDIREDPDGVRRSIGVVSQASTIDVELTAWENMNIYAKYYDVPAETRKERIKELLDVVGLAERTNFTVGSYSGGMKRRLELVRSLIHQPKVLFLDEPTTGLDPQARSAVLEYLRELHKRHDITIVLTTHYLDEAETLCDRLAIVDYGKVVALGNSAELKRNATGGDIVEAEVAALPNQALEALKTSKFALDVKKRESTLTVLVRNGAEAVPQIVQLVDANGGGIQSITLRAPTLDDVFLYYTGRSIREDTNITNKRFVSSWGR
jgi:ABC-2 type transport system ATP-binding protein